MAGLATCTECAHQEHKGRECGAYVTEEIHDTVGFAGPPTGNTYVLIKLICRCGRPHVCPESFACPICETS